MPLVLTTPIIPPRTLGVDISKPTDDQEAESVLFIVTALTNGGAPLPGKLFVRVANGECRGLRAGTDTLAAFTLALPTGYSDLTAAIVAVAPSARKATALTWLAANGVLPPGTTT